VQNFCPEILQCRIIPGAEFKGRILQCRKYAAIALINLRGGLAAIAAIAADFLHCRIIPGAEIKGLILQCRKSAAIALINLRGGLAGIAAIAADFLHCRIIPGAEFKGLILQCTTQKHLPEAQNSSKTHKIAQKHAPPQARPHRPPGYSRTLRILRSMDIQDQSGQYRDSWTEGACDRVGETSAIEERAQQKNNGCFFLLVVGIVISMRGLLLVEPFAHLSLESL